MLTTGNGALHVPGLTPHGASVRTVFSLGNPGTLCVLVSSHPCSSAPEQLLSGTLLSALGVQEGLCTLASWSPVSADHCQFAGPGQLPCSSASPGGRVSCSGVAFSRGLTGIHTAPCWSPFLLGSSALLPQLESPSSPEVRSVPLGV